MRWRTEQGDGAPLRCDREEGLEGGPVFLPKLEPARLVWLWQGETEEGRIRLNACPVAGGEATRGPDPARLGQFPRFAPIMAAL